MKKTLLSLSALLLASAASAGVAGTYTTESFNAYEYVGYKVSTEVSWSNEDTDPWEVTITENEDGTYSVFNLVDWEATLTATYDETDGTLVIPAGSLLDEEEGYAITGSKYGIEDLLSKLNASGSWILSSLCQDIKLEAKDGKLTALNPMFIYIVDTSYDSYAGYIYEGYGNVFADYSLAAKKEMPKAGVYRTSAFKAYEYEGYKVSTEVSWSNEDTDAWEVTLTDNGDGTYTIYNLVDWEATLTATYDETDGTLVIPAGSLLDAEEGYAITGSKYGIEDLLSKLNASGSWVLSSICTDIKFAVGGGTLTALNPMFIYIVDSSYDSYAGYIYEGYGNVFADYALEYTGPASGIKNVINSKDAPVEYYNLQGVRLSNPAPGQIVIKRQGSNVLKMMVR